MIKSTYDSADEIPEQYRELFVQRGDKFEIAIEGVKPESAFEGQKRALEAERERARQIEQHWKQWAPLAKHDPAHIQSILDKLPEYEALAKQGNDQAQRLEEIASARVKAATLPLERERESLREQHAQAMARLQELEASDTKRRIADAIRSASQRVGLDPDSAEDAIMLGSVSLEVAADGVVQVRDGVPGVPAGVDAERWLAHIRDSGMRPRWWAENVSGGLRGGQHRTSGPANPWAKDSFNLTEQSRIESSDPALARRLRDSAG